eukprot:3619479-Alexandrium_andersonii.AAC.1
MPSSGVLRKALESSPKSRWREFSGELPERISERSESVCNVPGNLLNASGCDPAWRSYDA